jgi:hypothetical protein
MAADFQIAHNRAVVSAGGRWELLTPRQRTAAIYREMRIIDEGDCGMVEMLAGHVEAAGAETGLKLQTY